MNRYCRLVENSTNNKISMRSWTSRQTKTISAGDCSHICPETYHPPVELQSFNRRFVWTFWSIDINGVLDKLRIVYQKRLQWWLCAAEPRSVTYDTSRRPNKIQSPVHAHWHTQRERVFPIWIFGCWDFFFSGRHRFYCQIII